MKIVILGPDGAGKSSVINGLVERLSREGRAITVRHLKPNILIPLRGDPGAIVADPHGKPPRSALFSLIKIIIWLVEEWYANLFLDKNNTLLICDRYYHDLLIDSKRYRYGGPRWAAELVGTLMPQPALWVLLEAPVEVLQARKQEVASEETARQLLAYKSFVEEQRNQVIVDASRPLSHVVTEVEAAVASHWKSKNL
jgi:thymidylate kinase